MAYGSCHACGCARNECECDDRCDCKSAFEMKVFFVPELSSPIQEELLDFEELEVL